MVISPVSLGYARFCLESLFRNSAEPLHLHLITDSLADKDMLVEELTLRQKTADHQWSVFAEDELADREASVFGQYPSLRQFRQDSTRQWDPVMARIAAALQDQAREFPDGA